MPNRIIVTLSFISTLCFSLVLNTNELFAHSPKKKDVLSLKEIKKTYRQYRKQKQNDNSMNSFYQKIKAFDSKQISIYNTLHHVLSATTIKDSTVIAFVEKISNLTNPSLAIEVIKLDVNFFTRNSSLDDVYHLTKLQVDAYKACVFMEKIPISLFKNIRNSFQLKVVIRLLETRQSQSLRVFLDSPFYMDSQMKLDIFEHCHKQSILIPSVFWDLLETFSNKQPASVSYYLKTIDYFRQKKPRLTSFMWKIVAFVSNKYAFDSLVEIDKRKMTYDSTRRFSYQNAMKDSEQLTLADKQGYVSQGIFDLLYKIDNPHALEAIKYLMDDKFDQALFFDFMEHSHIEPSIIPMIRRDAQLQVFKLFIARNYKIFRQKVIPFADSLLEVDTFKHINDAQYQAIKYESDQDPTKDVTLTSCNYIKNMHQFRSMQRLHKKGCLLLIDVLLLIENSYLEDVFQSLLALDVTLITPDVMQEFLSIDSSLHSLVVNLLKQVKQLPSNIIRQVITTMLACQNQYQLQIISEYMTTRNAHLLDDNLLLVSNEYQKKAYIEIANRYSVSHYLQLPLFLDKIVDDIGLFVLLACLDENRDLDQTFQKLDPDDSMLEVARKLHIEDYLYHYSLNKMQMTAEPKEHHANLPRCENKLDHKMRSILETHPKKKQLLEGLKRSGKKQCLTTGCPEFVSFFPGSTNYECSCCKAYNCYSCQQTAHALSCDVFSRLGRKVLPSSYPGLDNFRYGLSNVCFINSVIKTIVEMMASSSLFRAFMDPVRSSLLQRKEESASVYKARDRVKKVLHQLTENLLSGFSPYEGFNAKLMTRLVVSLNRYLVADNIMLDGSLGNDQFDAQEIFNLLLDIIDFGQQEPFQLQQVVTFEKLDGTVIKTSPEKASARVFVDLDGMKDVQQAFSKSLEPVLFNDENKYFNEKESQYIDAKKTVSITNMPEFLIIVMKRYAFDLKSGSQNRISKKISVSDQIVMNRVKRDQVDVNETKMLYRRIAAIVHHGETPHFGHYSCYLWRNENRSNKKQVLTASHHDDDQVKPSCDSSAGKCIRTNAYIVVYQLDKNVSI